MSSEKSILDSESFVETKLATKFADFNIRVYPQGDGKETVVLSSKNLDLKHPVLVRVHSECLTGDTFGSLHCDCGKQLNKSLQIIAEEGGVLIYLRQEGRGIGLFEKIRAYQLQSKGYDTFEANVRLGHQPDLRSYEMVKTALDDLQIKRIRLLTNNPSKVSDIAKLGIEVVERIPLISRPNKHNKSYLETKRKKFQHFIAKPCQHYYYQFQVDDAKQVDAIKEYLQGKKKDPLLKFCIGISAKPRTLHDKKEIKRIEDILAATKQCPDFVSVIHFSFAQSTNILQDAKELKKAWPAADRVQLNDLPHANLNELRELFSLFKVDFPLDDDSFDLIYDEGFRELVKKHKSYVLLDNSKGKGIKEPKNALMRKIDVLLAHGLNDIGLCGGFGPNELENYFAMRRYYRINFSVDAETKLKTKGKIDLEKTKTYLFQLMRFDDPKQQSIEQTRKFLEQIKRSDWEKAEISGHEFLIHPKVFHAGRFPSSAWFASELCKLVKDESSFCEIGCGSGAVSCLVALAHPHLKVTATDINPFASKNTTLNAKRLGLHSRLKVTTGDVLDSIKPNHQFDTIFWSLPFGFLDPGTPITLEEQQVFDPGYSSICKFFQKARLYLKQGGRLLIGFSNDLGNSMLLRNIVEQCSFELKKLQEKELVESVAVNFQIFEARPFQDNSKT